MNIEKDLNKAVRTQSQHKANLRHALLSHMDQTMSSQKTRSRKLWPLLFAVPASAFAVFAILTVLPIGNNGGSPGFVQNTLKPLTAQQVFAQAAAAVPDGSLRPGEYYYMKTFSQSVGYNKENTCEMRKGIGEVYLNEQLIPVKVVGYTQDGRLVQIDTETEDGMQRGDEFYWNEELNRSTYTPIDCPPLRYYSHENDTPLTQEDIDRLQSDPVHKAITALTLQMPSPKQQKEALELLSTADGWTLTQNVKVEGYQKPVTQLEHVDDDAGETTYFYFDPQSKRYIGQRNGQNVSIVLEQDTRPLKKNPEYKITEPIGQR